MSQKLLDLNDDLRRLREAGYNVSIDSGYLVVRDVPYVNEKREVRRGVLVSSLDLDGEKTIAPSTHVVRFSGEHPRGSDGNNLVGISVNKDEAQLTKHLSVQFSFSSKPRDRGYRDYYEKMTTYVGLLASPATSIDPSATALTYQVVEPVREDSPFNYLDTASARAEINMITAKLAVDKIAIVGLGGMGAYVLDLIAKTPVREIHLFDGDKFSSHNAFRAPGAASIDDLHKQHLKVEYLQGIYSRMHRGIVAHPEDVDADNVEELRNMACVFICIDNGASKRGIIEKLEDFGVIFIDVGLGLYTVGDTLGGIVRVTTSTADNRAAARGRISFSDRRADDIYDRNIQVADLNALNAIMAVLKWKKLRQFYLDQKHECNSTYTVGGNMLLSEDIHEPNRPPEG